MEKVEFLQHFKNSDENIEKLYLYYITSQKSSNIVITEEFYTIGICKVLESISVKMNCSLLFYGFCEDSERNLIAFGNCKGQDISVFENTARVIKISYNDKFAKLNHRDFLGSIMSLGFTREKMGDLILEGNCVYVPIITKFTEYIIQNLIKVRNVSVNISVELFNKLPQKRFETLCKVIPSLRIDSIVASFTNLSREKCKILIKSKNVKINSTVETDIDSKICKGDIIVVSGYGKFKIVEVLGKTSKDKIRVVIDKFI